MQIPVHHREPTQEPKPNAWSADEFTPYAKGSIKQARFEAKQKLEEVEEIILPQEELKNGYYTLLIFVTSGMIIGAILATITMFAIYGTAIERGNLMYETDDLIKQVQYNTDVIRDKVQKNADILPRINENIDKLGSGIVSELKPKEAKIVNQ